MMKPDYRHFALLNGCARKGELPSSFYSELNAIKKKVKKQEEAMLQGTCGGQLTLVEAQEHHRCCRNPPVVVQVTEPMEEDPFDDLPTLVEGIGLEKSYDKQEGDVNLECHPFWDDPMAEVIKASIGPILPDLAEFFKGFTLPTTGAIKKQRRANSSEKACAVSA